MRDFDPRVTPFRADLAAKFLEGKVPAAALRRWPRLTKSIAPQAPLRHEPRPDAPLDTEALKGERVTIYDENEEGWAWGQLAADGYVGWLPSASLAPPGAPPTHKVASLRTFAFPGPSIKLPPIEAFPFGAQLAIARVEDRMAVTQSGFYVPAVHLKPIGDNETDFVSVAERFLGAPYLWGGKTALGLDCSGLVQIALAACGVACPRDSDMQERRIRAALSAMPAIRNSSAAISCFGRATSPSCATPRICFMPTPSTWRWRANRLPRPSPASVPRAAKSPACGALRASRY